MNENLKIPFPTQNPKLCIDKEYIKNIQSSVDNLTQQYYGYSDAMSVTVKTTNDSEY